MRVIIVDDEVTSSQVLENLIENNLPDIEIMAVCNSAYDAIEKLNSLNPDLVFMDIELPGMTGFDILEKITSIQFDIIFTTAHSQFGIKAIQFSAIDYLLKPINSEELIDAVNRVKLHKKHTNPLEQIKILLENIHLYSNNNPFNRIAFPSSDGLKFVNTSEIVHCTSSSNYTTIFLSNNTKLLVSKTLKEIENVLTPTIFCRIHNSNLVNINFIKKFIKGDIPSIELNDGTELEVSRRKKDELIKMLNL
jgi:two-component system LytT family response regulator